MLKDWEIMEKYGEIIRTQSEIIDSLYQLLCLHRAADDIDWHNLDKMMEVTRLRREVDGQWRQP